MRGIKVFVRILGSVFLLFYCAGATAQTPDPNSYYLYQGEGVGSWELSLNFGTVILDTERAGQTIRGSLTASPGSMSNTINLKWSPKGLKNEWGTIDENVLTLNLINRLAPVDLTSVVDQAALVFDIRVIRAPKKHVDLTVECNWDWQCRSTIPIKQPLRKLPKNEWVTFPVPLQCLDKDGFDFSKLTTSFMLQTTGKMEIELGDVRLAAFPPDQVKC